jgi:L-ascorbate metabolism protein UlaG (beta-lactamase superfamily)
MNNDSPVPVIPIEHATAVLLWKGDGGDTVIYTDPVGGAEAFAKQPAADLVLVTDIHGDHMDAVTLGAVIGDASLVTPQAVKDLLPEELAMRALVVGNGESVEVAGLTVSAIPMYNLPESPKTVHPKGRGNGYVVERDGFRVYVAGDTSGIPEMRALKNIDIALVPMNLPYTMDVDEAANAVLAFAPRTVYPYHYRGKDGLSDVNHFKELVNAGNPDINVVLVNWY